MMVGFLLSHYDWCVLIIVGVHVGEYLDHHQLHEGSHPEKESLNKLGITMARVYC